MAERAWLISGVPGSGKSTTARTLAAVLPASAHIPGDWLARLVVSGLHLPVPRGDAEGDRQIALCVRNQCLLARSFSASGFEPIIEYVVTRRDLLDQYVDLLRPLELHLVVLSPAWHAVVARDRERGRDIAPAWRYLLDDLAQLRGLGQWVDSTDLTVEEVCHRILEDPARSLLPLLRT